MSTSIRYIQGYPDHLVSQVQSLIDSGQLISNFQRRYPKPHKIQSEKALFQYVNDIKQRYMKKSAPLSKAVYDAKIHLVNNALGLHTYVAKVHGNRVVSKNEIRIASMFKNAPEPLLRMLVVHELAHFKEKEHNKAFYSLCCHMEPSYHQLEFDARLFLICEELKRAQ
ncbi:YgjP-like metallopeptidase domain-containing protein [Vibrio agarivorans]|uniref:YgjP-like metallopeptidase domain-containing protein n=1 Tax=Vibrio agarivorans TaxID=153622 RepID=UPI00223178EA|nr:M48 family metallopeptidase [Vibrio agarivorans]MDN3663565.1 M48 family metallopeptidase [Vibrio agarivorans]